MNCCIACLLYLLAAQNNDCNCNNSGCNHCGSSRNSGCNCGRKKFRAVAVAAINQEILNVAAVVAALTAVAHRHLTAVIPPIPAVTARVSMYLSAIPAAAVINPNCSQQNRLPGSSAACHLSRNGANYYAFLIVYY